MPRRRAAQNARDEAFDKGEFWLLHLVSLFIRLRSSRESGVLPRDGATSPSRWKQPEVRS